MGVLGTRLVDECLSLSLSLSSLLSCRQVLAELSKIERFDAILSGRPAPPSSSSSSSSCVAAESKRGCGLEGCGQDMPQFVRDALQRTTDVVQGIDTILRK